jgi:hypothetical protein
MWMLIIFFTVAVIVFLIMVTVGSQINLKEAAGVGNFPKVIETIVAWIQLNSKKSQLSIEERERKRVKLSILILWILVMSATFLLDYFGILFQGQLEREAMQLEREEIRSIPTLILELDTEQGVDAILRIKDIGAPAMEPLITLLKDEDPALRAGAAQGLGWIGESDAIEPLIFVLNDVDFRVRAEAAWALGEIKDESAVDPLIALLNDDISTVRIKAAGALLAIGDERAVEPLTDLLKRKDYEVIAAQSEFFIGIAKPGDEPVFIYALNYFGTTITATNYLNSGNLELAQAAQEWANYRGYEITYARPGETFPHWGGE